MAATAKSYDVTQIRQGPGDLWVVGTAPDDTAVRLTLTSLTPDATAHPSSVCLGLTKKEILTEIKQKITEITVDQADAPVDAYLEMTDAMISAEVTQQGLDLLQQAYNVGTYATASGYKQLTFGGIGTIPKVCVAAIQPKKEDLTKAVVTLLYRAIPVGGLQILMGRGAQSSHKIQFKGLADISRSAGKQIGVVYETIA